MIFFTIYLRLVLRGTGSPETITIRHLDSMEQERVAIADLGRIIGEKVSWKNLLG